MPQLPDFRLETWLSKWEFSARYHMTVSDAQSMTLAQLLDLASPEDREAFGSLWLGYGTDCVARPPEARLTLRRAMPGAQRAGH